MDWNVDSGRINHIFIAVVLLDTTKEATLEWTRYPYGPQAQTPGVSIVFSLFLFF